MKQYKQIQVLVNGDRQILDRRDVANMTYAEYTAWRGQQGAYLMTNDREPSKGIGDALRYSDNWYSYWTRNYDATLHEFNPMLWNHIHTLFPAWKAWGDANGVEVILEADGLCRPPKGGAYGAATVDWKVTFKNRFCDQEMAFKSLVWDRRHDRGLCLRPAGETEYHASGLHHQWDKRIKYRTIEDLARVIQQRVTEWSIPTYEDLMLYSTERKELPDVSDEQLLFMFVRGKVDLDMDALDCIVERIKALDEEWDDDAVLSCMIDDAYMKMEKSA